MNKYILMLFVLCCFFVLFLLINKLTYLLLKYNYLKPKINKYSCCFDEIKLINNLKAINSRKGFYQYSILKRKINSFAIVILEQLDENEILFVRYVDVAEKICQVIQDNLNQYYLVMTSIETINGEQLLVQVRKNDQLAKPLKQRLDLWKEQSIRANNILLKNEQQLTNLDNITLEIANMKFGKQLYIC